jgi:hypothetical protein
MKFKEDRPFANPEAALAKLLEISNAVEADHAGRKSARSTVHSWRRVATSLSTARRCIARLPMAD